MAWESKHWEVASYLLQVMRERPGQIPGLSSTAIMQLLEIIVFGEDALYVACSHGNSTVFHCKKSMVILSNKNGYLVLSTLGTEQRYKECARCVGRHPGGIER